MLQQERWEPSAAGPGTPGVASSLVSLPPVLIGHLARSAAEAEAEPASRSRPHDQVDLAGETREALVLVLVIAPLQEPIALDDQRRALSSANHRMCRHGSLDDSSVSEMPANSALLGQLPVDF